MDTNAHYGIASPESIPIWIAACRQRRMFNVLHHPQEPLKDSGKSSDKTSFQKKYSILLA